MHRLALVAILASMSVGCTAIHRAQTYPKDDEITRVSWYRPTEAVPGRDTGAFPNETHPAIAAEALEAVRKYCADRRTTGLLVLHDGKTALEWYADGYDATSTTNSMSMAKTVMALVFGILQEEGRFPSVDTPITSVFPEFGNDESAKYITWRDLLEMTSGLRNDQELKLGSDLVKMHLGTDIPATVLAIPSIEPSGLHFDYNNVNTQLIGMAIERATGQRLSQVLSDRLWRPIGASDATLWLDHRGGTAHAYCCLFANARDWGHVGELMLDGGRVGGTTVVPRDWITQMTLPSRTNPDYGWFLWRADSGPSSERAKERSERLLDAAMFWLDGKDTQRVYVLPAERIVVVRVGEEPADWDDSFVPNTLIRGLSR